MGEYLHEYKDNFLKIFAEAVNSKELKGKGCTLKIVGDVYKRQVEKIKKVTSGSTPEIGKKVNEVYASVITAGTHLAPTMKVAEAAKVIEMCIRDSIICRQIQSV